jgi:hypothetical protein
VPIEPSPRRSPSPAFDRLIIEDEESCGGRDGHGNTSTPSGLGSPQNPILTDIDYEKGDTESDLGSERNPILIEDRDTLPQSEDAELEGDSRPSIEDQPVPLGNSSASAQRQNGGHFREGSPAAQLPSLQDAGGQDKLSEPAVAMDKSVPMTRKASHNTDATLADEMDPGDDGPAGKMGTIFWRHITFYVTRNPVQGRPNELLTRIALPRAGGEAESPVE